MKVIDNVKNYVVANKKSLIKKAIIVAGSLLGIAAIGLVVNNVISDDETLVEEAALVEGIEYSQETPAE